MVVGSAEKKKKKKKKTKNESDSTAFPRNELKNCHWL